MRLHYLIAENLELSKCNDFVYDVSDYEDIRDLYLISDILLTDYSSVFFDYKVLNKPVIFYSYDIDEYRDELRGFYFNYEKEVPGPIVKNTEAVIEEINKIDSDLNNYSCSDKGFVQKYCSLEDGNSSKRVVEKIFNL